MAYIKEIAARFKEPSSWGGLAAFLAIVGVNLDSGVIESIVYVGAGAAGLIAFFLPDA